MKLLLIDQNPIIQKLVSLSAQKSNIDVEVAKSMGDSFDSETYDFVFIDDDVFDAALFEELKSRVNSSSITLIFGKNKQKLPGFDSYIQKPFLPTELVDFFSEQKQKDLSIFDDKRADSFNSLGMDDTDRLKSDVGEPSLDIDEKGDFPSFGINDDMLKSDSPLEGLGELKEQELPESMDILGDLGELESGTLDGLSDIGDLGSDATDTDELDIQDMETKPYEMELGGKELGVELDDEEADMGSDLIKPADVPQALADIEDMNDLNLDEPDSFDSVQDDIPLEMPEIMDISELDEAISLEETPEAIDEMSEMSSIDEMPEIGESLLAGEAQELDMTKEDEIDNEAIDADVTDISNGGILDRDEINEVKELLEDGDIGDIGDLETDEELTKQEDGMQDMKIENSELASLTEEALSEALGESRIDSIGDGLEELESMTDGALGDEEGHMGVSDEIESAVGSDISDLQVVDATSFVKSKGANDSLGGLSSIVSAIGQMDTEKLRKVLDGLQITVQLSYPNKQ